MLPRKRKIQVIKNTVVKLTQKFSENNPQNESHIAGLGTIISELEQEGRVPESNGVEWS